MKLPELLLHYAIGVIACGVSFLGHLTTPLVPGRQNKEDMFDHTFGLYDPHPDMADARARIAWRWKDFFHHRKNLVVEHCRRHPQRWVKATACICLAREVLGIIL